MNLGPIQTAEKELLSQLRHGTGSETRRCHVCNGDEPEEKLYPLVDRWVCEPCMTAWAKVDVRKGDHLAMVRLVSKLMADLTFAADSLQKVKKALAPKNCPGPIVFDEVWLKNRRRSKEKRRGC